MVAGGSGADIGRCKARRPSVGTVWWAFTFPLGAFVAARWRLGTQRAALPPIVAVGAVALALPAAAWTQTFARSVRGVLNGTPHG